MIRSQRSKRISGNRPLRAVAGSNAAYGYTRKDYGIVTDTVVFYLLKKRKRSRVRSDCSAPCGAMKRNLDISR